MQSLPQQIQLAQSVVEDSAADGFSESLTRGRQPVEVGHVLASVEAETVDRPGGKAGHVNAMPYGPVRLLHLPDCRVRRPEVRRPSQELLGEAFR